MPHSTATIKPTIWAGPYTDGEIPLPFNMKFDEIDIAFSTREETGAGPGPSSSRSGREWIRLAVGVCGTVVVLSVGQRGLWARMQDRGCAVRFGAGCHALTRRSRG